MAHRDLSRARNRIVCRLHAVLCDLVPGGFAKEISAAQADQALADIVPLGATAAARLELAHELLDRLRNVDEQLRSTKRGITRIVAASKTTLTDLYGVGPIIAATVLGYVGDIHRFVSRDQFAAYDGTAPIEASSASQIVHRLSRRICARPGFDANKIISTRHQRFASARLLDPHLTGYRPPFRNGHHPSR
jgi:transposase